MSYFLQEGMRLHHAERYEDALKYFDRARKLEPASAAAHECIAWTLRALGKTEEAMIYYNRAIMCCGGTAEEWPAYYYLYLAKGDLLAEMGSYSEALHCFDVSWENMCQLEISGQEKAYLLKLKGDALREAGQLDEALECYSQGAELDTEGEFDFSVDF